MKTSIFFTVLLLQFWFTFGASAGDSLTACSLLTHDEAEKAAGVRLSEGQLTTFDMPFMRGTTLCYFESLDSRKYDRFISLELTVTDSKTAAAEKWHNALTLIEAPEPVTGIGEEAVWGGDVSRPRGGLTFRQDKYLLEIKLYTGNENKGKKTAEKLAAGALKRLPE